MDSVFWVRAERPTAQGEIAMRKVDAIELLDNRTLIKVKSLGAIYSNRKCLYPCPLASSVL
jgi:hypothetical protein